MAVYTPDDIEEILENVEERDYSNNVSKGVEETSHSTLVEPRPSFDNVLQDFSESWSHWISLRGLMTHQAPQNVQSFESSQTVWSHGGISLQDKNLPNPDWNNSKVS